MTTSPSNAEVRPVPPARRLRRGMNGKADTPEDELARPVTQKVAGRRLIVLVPDLGIDDAEMARQIWEIASPPRLTVLYLGLCRHSAEEAQMQRRLITLSALTSDPRVSVKTRLEFGNAWPPKVKATLRADDIIVCHAEQRAGFWHTPLSRVLETLGAPVWTLSGFYEPMNASMAEPLKEIIFWVISIAILIGFTFIQIRVVRLSKDWAQSILLYLSILVEAGLLWAWHHLSS